MPALTSTQYASAAATGKDWRDTSKSVLEQLDAIRGADDGYNFGFVYLSDALADDATSILNLFTSVTGIKNWIGAVGKGVVGGENAHLNTPALSAMIGRLPEGSFKIFPSDSDTEDDEDDKTTQNTESQADVTAWLLAHDPRFGIIHADPTAETDPQDVLGELSNITNAFLIGGMTASNKAHALIANGVFSNSVSGAFFSDAIPIATTLSQGCRAISDMHTITKMDERAIISLNDRPALDVLQDDLRALAAEKTGTDADFYIKSLRDIASSDEIPEEFKPLFQRTIHAGLPLTLSDQKDYMVRDIVGIHANEASITLSDQTSVGQHIVFMERDNTTMKTDLTQNLIALRRRVTAERGCFEPKAALYISGAARTTGTTNTAHNEEITLIRDIIGTCPMTGFYAGGEINNARLYGYTGVLTLFF